MSTALIFDTSTVEASAYDPVPAGTYEVMAVDSTGKNTKAGNGWMVEFKLEIQTGEYKGRLLWDRFVLKHPSKDAVRINEQRLRAFALAAGKEAIQESGDLHFLPVMARVVVRQLQDGTPTNEIKGYTKVPPATAAASTPAVKPAAAETVAPW